MGWQGPTIEHPGRALAVLQCQERKYLAYLAPGILLTGRTVLSGR